MVFLSVITPPVSSHHGSGVHHSSPPVWSSVSVVIHQGPPCSIIPGSVALILEWLRSVDYPDCVQLLGQQIPDAQ